MTGSPPWPILCLPTGVPRRLEVGCDRKAADLLVEGHPLQSAIALQLWFHIPWLLLSSSPDQSLSDGRPVLFCTF